MKIPSFDPKEVPIVATGHGLPSVSPYRLTPQGLRAHFQSPPIWHPEIRAEPAFSSRPPAQAAVLIGIVDHPEPTILLTQRTAAMSTHAGQVAFPGGKVDAADADVVAAALREAHEETGLSSQWVTVLGKLPVYTTGTNFWVTPVVALIRPGFTLQANPHEVDDIFEVPLAFLMDPASHRRHQLSWDGNARHWYSMSYQAQGSADDGHNRERFIWGATAGMLRNLYHFLVA